MGLEGGRLLKRTNSEPILMTDTLNRSKLTLVIPVSSCMMICVLRAIRALNGVGRANASSKELVWRD